MYLRPFIADETTIQAAPAITAIPISPDPSVKVVYGDWVVCRLIYYHIIGQ
jgi:hypothetical protein